MGNATDHRSTQVEFTACRDTLSSALPDFEVLRNQNSVGEKILLSRRKAHLSQKELARALEKYKIYVADKAVSRWEQGQTLPSVYQLFAVCYELQIGDAVKYFTDCTISSADYSPDLNQQGLRILQQVKEALVDSGKYAPSSRHSTSVPLKEILVKVFRAPAAAGLGNFLDGEDFDMIPFDEANVPVGTDFGIRISGDSMLPRYVQDQIVFVQQCEELSPGEIGVFVYNDCAYVKQYRESAPSREDLQNQTCDGHVYPNVTLYSLNRDRADCDVHVHEGDSLFVVGRVLS